MIFGCRSRDVLLLLPVKPLTLAKSRLGLANHDRQVAARRLFQHTLDVALRCVNQQQIFVLTSDPTVEQLASQQGVTTLFDTAGELNTALDGGLQTLRRKFPHAPIAVMVTDLPLLTPPVLTKALFEAAASTTARHVVDHRGTGTTFVSLPRRTVLPMVFGPDSAKRFSDAGSIPMLFPPPEISRDLDVNSDLSALNSHQKEHFGPNTSSP